MIRCNTHSLMLFDATAATLQNYRQVWSRSPALSLCRLVQVEFQPLAGPIVPIDRGLTTQRLPEQNIIIWWTCNRAVIVCHPSPGKEER